MSTQSLTLYQIEDHLAALLDTIDLVESPEQQSEIEREIERTVSREIAKVDGICQLLAHFESQQQLAQSEIRRLQECKARFQRAEERLKTQVLRVMTDRDLKKLEGETATLQRKNSPNSVLITDFERVPAGYKIVKVETSIDKSAVKKALEAGESVPGADLNIGGSYLVRR